MASTSPSELARQLLNACLAGAGWPEAALDELAAAALDRDEDFARSATRALFATLIEGLADRFEPALSPVYAQMMARVIATARPELHAAELVRRYREVSRVRPAAGDPERVVVLSRVTLGADVAITSLVLDAAKQRFPTSEICLAGPEKAWQLFDNDLRLRHIPVEYGRGGLLRERLDVFDTLAAELASPDTVLLDPDSRLTQLGLLPVADAARHYLFDSRAYGGDGGETLVALTRRWLDATLGVAAPTPFIAPKLQPPFGGMPLAAVSLGVGENPAKRLPDPFEAELLRRLARLGLPIAIDKGAGGEEAERVERAAAAAPEAQIVFHDGTFASFAAVIAQSRFYAGYDSAGQHVAAALGVPLISVFAGFPCERMLRRWTPDGPGSRTVIPVRNQPLTAILDAVDAALCA